MIGSAVVMPALACVAIALVMLACWATQSTSTFAQTLPPRPPTPAPQPTRVPHSSDDNGTTMQPGRITGTVIDATTGAPAPGIGVVVGDATVTTDQNGNYDRNGLAPGVYQIRLDLPQLIVDR